MDKGSAFHPRMEHCTVLRPGQAQKIKELGIGVSVQPEFIVDDWWAENRLGPERCRMAYPLASLVRNDVKVGISTDSPVEPANPWFTVDAAVNRGRGERGGILQFSPDEALDLKSVLHLYTSGSAELLLDKDAGTLEDGKLADFVVLDIDPFETRDLKVINVLETYVGGARVFERSTP